jgi:glucokinase
MTLPSDNLVIAEVLFIFTNKRKVRDIVETKWLSSDFNHHRIILAGDIGGTNTNLAIVGEKKGKFTIILEVVFRSQEIDGLIVPLQKLLSLATEKDAKLKPTLCCISAAGAVENNCCKMTNVKWAIDGAEIQQKIGVKTVIINDFLAISYGIPTLDTENPEQIQKVPHADGSTPKAAEGAKAVIGPGTGLGVSYIAYNKGTYIPCPSEGGHIIMPTFDDETDNLKKYLHKKFGEAPGVEPFVSGQGISNIYAYYRDVKGLAIEGIFQKIEETPPADRPALIATNAGTNATCKEIMKLFVRMLGRFGCNIVAAFMPVGGLYLAGGVTIKNSKLLLENNLFMSEFEKSYKTHIVEMTKKTPVYIIKDYSISLYGAANAAINLIG